MDYNQNDQQQNYQQPVYEQPVYEQPVYEQPMYQQPLYQDSPFLDVPDAGSFLTKGILAMVFAEVFPILGFIFGLQGLGMKNKYVNAGVPLTGKAKVGAILSKIGLILSIVMAVFWVVYIIYCFAIGFMLGKAETTGMYY